jgi:hypothetical protein
MGRCWSGRMRPAIPHPICPALFEEQLEALHNLADGEPAWLLAWRVQQTQPQQAPPPAPPPPPVPRSKKTGPTLPLRMRGQALAIGIIEPESWSFEGCVRREPVFDIDHPPRAWSGRWAGTAA